MKNIVLIGMPGSGKTTVGKKLTSKTGKTLIDTDDEIIKEIGMPISQYFQKFGNEKFREVEVQVIEKLSKRSDCIIATGGGAVLNPLNVSNLKKNGVVYFLNRSIQTLAKNCHCNDGKNNGSRPLVKTQKDIENLYNQRFPIYKASCDVEIEDKPAEFIANEIIQLHGDK